ncbi:GNAT family N-acetyltransferase [Maridesulfovibrio sp.]|uniref:GNAT family N-acetyltransferase n=1 Tax=Maridesulfovibrio sp. TaxID=2795000 RepID=UPI002A18D618|nr:GNAT family N-acetyltransferase [Maridesulfovibrio sp.]
MQVSGSREQNLARLREESYVIEPGRKFEVDYFRPEDAVGVTRLYHAVYGEMFPVDSVYDADELIRINEGDDMFQVVGRTSNGDVVGLYALFKSAPSNKIMEGGSWIVHPDYRGTSLGLRLVSKIHNNPPEHIGLEALFGQSVCDYATPQKLVKRFNAKPCAFEIEAMPPRPGDEDSYGRISLLDSFLFLHNHPDEVYLPDRYDSQLRDLYEFTGLDRKLQRDQDAEKAAAADGETALSTNAFDGVGLLKVEVETVGRDFAESLAEVLREHGDMSAYHLFIPLWRPGSSMVVEAARREGFFFGGLLPLWFDRDALLLQKLAETPDFSKPCLYLDGSRELLDMVEADWKTVQYGD